MGTARCVLLTLIAVVGSSAGYRLSGGALSDASGGADDSDGMAAFERGFRPYGRPAPTPGPSIVSDPGLWHPAPLGQALHTLREIGVSGDPEVRGNLFMEVGTYRGHPAYCNKQGLWLWLDNGQASCWTISRRPGSARRLYGAGLRTPDLPPAEDWSAQCGAMPAPRLVLSGYVIRMTAETSCSDELACRWAPKFGGVVMGGGTVWRSDGAPVGAISIRMYVDDMKMATALKPAASASLVDVAYPRREVAELPAGEHFLCLDVVDGGQVLAAARCTFQVAPPMGGYAPAAPR